MYMYSIYLCGKVVYDSYRDTGITGGCSQGDTESIRYKRLETPVCTYLDKSTATVTTYLKRNKTHSHTGNTNTCTKSQHNFNCNWCKRKRGKALRGLEAIKHYVSVNNSIKFHMSFSQKRQWWQETVRMLQTCSRSSFLISVTRGKFNSVKLEEDNKNKAQRKWSIFKKGKTEKQRIQFTVNV